MNPNKRPDRQFYMVPLFENSSSVVLNLSEGLFLLNVVSDPLVLHQLGFSTSLHTHSNQNESLKKLINFIDQNKDPYLFRV